MAEMTRARRPQKPYGLDMQQIAMKKIFTEAENQVADQAGDDDRPETGGYLLIPGRGEDKPHDCEDRAELRGNEKQEEQRRRRVLRSALIGKEIECQDASVIAAGKPVLREKRLGGWSAVLLARRTALRVLWDHTSAVSPEGREFPGRPVASRAAGRLRRVR